MSVHRVHFKPVVIIIIYSVTSTLYLLIQYEALTLIKAGDNVQSFSSLALRLHRLQVSERPALVISTAQTTAADSLFLPTLSTLVGESVLSLLSAHTITSVFPPNSNHSHLQTQQHTPAPGSAFAVLFTALSLSGLQPGTYDFYCCQFLMVEGKQNATKLIFYPQMFHLTL